MKSVPKKEKRSWVVSIVSGLITILSLYISVTNFKPDAMSILISITFLAFCILAAIIAIQGKSKTLGELMDSLPHLP